MIWRFGILALALAGAAVWIWAMVQAPERPILRLGSTTSTQDSGLLDYLIPLYEAEAGVEVVVIAKGTGAAIRDALAGQVDALLVHNQTREEELVAQGFALSRTHIMSNDFLIVGSTRQLPYKNLGNLMRDLSNGNLGLFLSRGDESGTHAAELRLWQAYGFDPDAFGDWYTTTGSSMGQTLITANANQAATLVDSATWARHGDREALHIWHDGQSGEDAYGLENPYGYLPLNPDQIPGVDAELALNFGDWLIGEDGQAAIAAYVVGGMKAFRPATLP